MVITIDCLFIELIPTIEWAFSGSPPHSRIGRITTSASISWFGGHESDPQRFTGVAMMLNAIARGRMP
jgi:hypothetical protein